MSKKIKAEEYMNWDIFINKPIEEVPVDTVSKKLQALEIIKKKTTDACNCLMILKPRTDNLDYHNYKKLFLTNLTEEEYDLLKEVLL